ncbi:MAG: hypothetical protein IPL86_09270 [Flavobacteriales bacterium]|nr:hypothetical protein [Flavobacteriales bacterium]
MPDTALVDLVLSHGYTRPDYLYKGIPNPVEFAVPGVECVALDVSISRGQIEGGGCSYSITPDTAAGFWYMYLVVSWQSGTQRLTAHHGFWVRDVPTPFAYFAGRSSEQDFIPYGEAIAGRGVLAKILDETTLGVDFKISYRISHYLLTLERDRSIVYDGFASGPELTPTMAEATAGIQIGDILRITEIKARSSQGKEVDLKPLEFVVK